jgi:alpha-beta hydrolase superfamily lysophospholipase
MKQFEDTLKAQQGTPDLFLRIWEPDKAVRAVMVLVHGLGEHSGRYDTHFAEFYTDAGLAILAPDLPGHGLTKGDRGHIAQTAQFLDYIDLLVNEAHRRYPEKPLFIYGHSMGGLITLWYALDRHPQVAGVIVTSPAIGVHDPVPALKKALAKFMNRISPAFSMENGLDVAQLSRDEQVVQAYVNDALVHSRISARLGLMMLSQGDWILEHAPENQNRMLVMIGSQEGIVSKDAVDKFCQIAPNVTYKVWPDLFHEIHNEAENLQVFAFTKKWMDERLS